MDPDVRREAAEQRPGEGYSPVLKNFTVKKEERRGEERGEDKTYSSQRAMLIMKRPESDARHRHEDRKSRRVRSVHRNVVLVQRMCEQDVIPFPKGGMDRNKARGEAEDQQSYGYPHVVGPRQRSQAREKRGRQNFLFIQVRGRGD